jgi:hypothetical protein
MIISLIVLLRNTNLKSKCYSLLQSLKNNSLFVGLILLFLAVFFVYLIIKPGHFDTYLYHMSSIQWIEQYRAVPGLANVQERLGFNSSIFVLSAGFSFYFLVWAELVYYKFTELIDILYLVAWDSF